jgi:hypothetical protein
LHQHPELARTVIDGDGDLAARLAAEHFHLSEGFIRQLIETVTPGLEETAPTAPPTKSPASPKKPNN